jgi:hypothetical protein
MHFEWIVPVVVLVVWLLQQLLRARENEEPVRPRPGAPAQGRGTSDIDRFLQEIDRMRRRPAGESSDRPRPAPPPVQRPRPVQAAPVPRVRPVPRPVTARSSEPPPEVIVVEAVQRGTPPAVVPVSTATPVHVAPRVSRALGDEGRRLAPGARAALELVRSPKSLAAAVLLQEILGPPRCRRR